MTCLRSHVSAIGLLLSLVPLCAGGCGGTRSGATGEERILDFQSQIECEPSKNTLLVAEKITAHSAGKQIRRGIYREILIRHSGQMCPVTVIETRLDGKEVPFRVEERDGGLRTRVYVVREAGRLPPGKHTFEVKYRQANRIERQGADHRLRVNATGVRWSFPIESATVRVELPEGVAVEDVHHAMSYRRGASDSPGSYNPESKTLIFQSDRTLPPGDGLVVSLEWPAE